MNGLKHGYWSRDRIKEYRRVRNAVRWAARNNEILPAFIRVRDGSPDLAPVYAMRLSAAQDRLRQLLEKLRPKAFEKSDGQTIGIGNYPTRPIS